MNHMFPSKIVDRLGQIGIVAVLVIDNPDHAVPLAKTLRDSGIGAMELTLRTSAAMESLRRILQEVPDMTAGVGTILNTEQADSIKKAGALFGVAPGYNASVVDHCWKINLPFAPGIATPSEIEGAVSQGCRVLKYFHAEGMGGTRYLKGINAPYSHLDLKYIPLGGLSPDNMRNYLEMPEILALGGSWIAPKEAINRADWSTIAQNAAVAVDIFREVRG